MIAFRFRPHDFFPTSMDTKMIRHTYYGVQLLPLPGTYQVPGNPGIEGTYCSLHDSVNKVSTAVL